MSDMSSLSHEYASSADFSRDINDAVLTLKKRFVRGEDHAVEPESRNAAKRLRDTLIHLLHRPGPPHQNRRTGTNGESGIWRESELLRHIIASFHDVCGRFSHNQ